MQLDPNHVVAGPIRTAMRTLAQRQLLCEVLGELGARATPVLILKGHALSQWLYSPAEQRDTADVDLLLPGKPHVDGLMAWLGARGFSRQDPGIAGDMVCFELACRGPPRAGLEVELDLHWRLSTLPAFAFRFEFDELMDASQPLPGLHPHARGLGIVHALAHACMHRAQNVPEGTHDQPKVRRDIELLCARLAPEEWAELSRLAQARGIAAVCLDGIDAAGASTLAQVPPVVARELRDAAARQGMDMSRMHRWAYVQWQCWRAFPTLKARLRWLRQRLWPDVQYLRHRHGAAAPNALGLRRVRIASGLRQAAGGRRNVE